MKADAEKAAAASGVKVADDEGEDDKKDSKGKKGKKTGGVNAALAAKIRE